MICPKQICSLNLLSLATFNQFQSVLYSGPAVLSHSPIYWGSQSLPATDKICSASNTRDIHWNGHHGLEAVEWYRVPGCLPFHCAAPLKGELQIGPLSFLACAIDFLWDFPNYAWPLWNFSFFLPQPSQSLIWNQRTTNFAMEPLVLLFWIHLSDRS